MNPSTPIRTRGIPIALSLAALALTSSPAVAAETKPIGHLDVAKAIVRSGHKVVVSWEIIYPLKLEELLSLSPTGQFKTTQDLDITVHAIGMEYQTVKSNNGHGNNADGVDVSNPGRGRGGPNGEVDRSGRIDDENKLNGNAKERQLELDATLWISEGGTWQELFQGGVSDLDGGLAYHESSLPLGTTVDLAAQGRSKRRANEVVSTTDPNPNLIVLKNGDTLPSSVGAFASDQVAGFLSPYVDSGHVQLGPTQLLFLFDLDATPGSSGFTLQDLGVLVNVKPNEQRTQRVNPPGISQFKGDQGGNLPPEISQFNREDRPKPGANSTPGGQPNPGPATNPSSAPDRGGNGNPGSIDHRRENPGNEPADLKKKGSKIQIGARQVIFLVDLETVQEVLGLSLEELKALLASEPSEKRTKLLNRIRALEILAAGSWLGNEGSSPHQRAPYVQEERVD